MDGMSREEFERMKQNAFESAIKTHKSRLPFPDFVSIPKQNEEETPKIKASPTPAARPLETGRNNQVSSLLKYLNLPEMLKNGDSLLLLGLILLLSNESADETLILALAYILL